MSHIQSRTEKNDGHLRKSGRSGGSGYHRGFSGGSGGGKAGGAYGPPAQSSTSSHDPSQNPSLSASRSFKKTAGGNGQGGQVRTVPVRTGSEGGGAPSVPTYRPVQNGSHTQAPSHGVPNAPVVGSSQTMNASFTKTPRDLPRPPTSQFTKGGPDPVAPVTPKKGEAHAGFTLQFGSISPGVVNGIQIPARTSSAPPNLDEQKRDQATRNPLVPVPSREQQPSQKKDVLGPSQPNTGPSQVPSVAKREISFQATASASMTAPKPSVPISGMSMAMFQPAQSPVQFGGHNPQIHSQSMPPGPLPMPIVPIPLGASPPMFVAGLQSHAMHQGHGLNFGGPMGHQISAQIGNMGMGIGPPYGQPHGNFGGPRKPAVKITHPETHEELKLDKATGSYFDPSGQRSHGNMSGKPQQMASFNHGHQTGYFQTNPYAPASVVYTAQSSAPNVGGQTSSPQTQNYNFPFSQSGNPVTIVNPPAQTSATTTKSGNLVQSIPESPNTESGHALAVSVTVPPIEVGFKNISLDKDGANIVITHEEAASTDKQKHNKLDSESSVHQNKSIAEPPSISEPIIVPIQKTELGDHLSVPGTTALDVVSSSTDSKKMEHVQRVDSVKVSQKVTSKEENQLTGQEHQVAISESTSRTGTQLSCPVADHGVSSQSGESEGQTVPDLLDSSNQRNHETMPDGSVSSTSSTITTDDAVPREPEHIESVATCDPVNLSVGGSSEATYLKQDENTWLEVELKQSSKELKESDKAQVSDDASVDISSAKIYPVSSGTGSSDDKQVKNLQAASVAENEIVQKPNNVVMEHTSDNEDKVSCTSALSGSFVSKGGEPISQEADMAVTATSLKGDTLAPSSPSSTSTGKDQHIQEIALANIGSGKKKKMKELLLKADAAGTNSDLYMAYKGPDEKREAKITSEVTDGSAVNVSQVPEDGSKKLVETMKKERQSKAELDDWEDAADITASLKMNGSRQPCEGQKHDNELESGSMSKKYSRDFLLTFSAQCTALPADFEIGSDLGNALMSVRARIIDRPSGPSHGPGTSFRQGANNGVLRGRSRILSGPGPVQPVPTHGVISRNNIDSDRWQRAPGSQRGLIPSPHMPVHQVMHVAEKRYEVGVVSDKEQAKQRQIKAILNKLTPQNFDRLFERVKEVDIDSATTLTGVISQIFDKALMEPTFCEMYANFCFYLSGALPDFSEKNEKITFKRLLLNKCQEEFERGEIEEAEAGKIEEDSEVTQTPQEREEKRLKARRRMLGNIRLIGELYKKKMLTERIMHECIKKLLGQHQKPDEEDIEALCKLMSTIGEMIDHSKAKEHMDAYFDMIKKLSINQTLSSRVRFMLKDAIDLRKNNWQQRRKVEGPKKIEEVHRDAAQERVQTSRSARGSGITSSTRRGPPVDYGHRSSTSLMSQSSQQTSGFRSFPSQSRGFGSQDVRMDDRHPVENRMSVPLPHRPMHDDSITLGPQGGLARGMSSKGQPLMQNAPLSDNTGENRRSGSGPNGPSSTSSLMSNSLREEVIARTSSARYSSTPYDHSSAHERIPCQSNKDFRKADMPDRSITSISSQDNVPSSIGNNIAASETMSDEHIREKSMSTIREYYSARDEKEVVLCIEELNSPSFYPSMVSLWVTDSFERKDADRDILVKLLVSLSKPQHGVLNQAQFIQGFEAVLMSLEDAVNDAPRAAEFLGRILAKIILEDVISFDEVGRLIREGGEEPGCLLKVGLASEVLGSILEIIKSEEGDAVLDKIRSSSNLRLEEFRPPRSSKYRKLEAFL